MIHFSGPLRGGACKCKIHDLGTFAPQVRLILQCDGHASLGDHPTTLYTEPNSISGSILSHRIKFGGFLVKGKNKLAVYGSAIFLAVLFAGCVSQPPKHPAYLHALSDLRTARWMLEHRPGDAAVSAHEGEAISEIDRAIQELTSAAVNDGKNIHSHPPADAPADYRGRLHKAADLLRKVRSDTYREEDNPSARGLRDRALGHVDAALHATERAIHDAEVGR
jgi:hypothetical protein